MLLNYRMWKMARILDNSHILLAGIHHSAFCWPVTFWWPYLRKLSTSVFGNWIHKRWHLSVLVSYIFLWPLYVDPLPVTFISHNITIWEVSMTSSHMIFETKPPITPGTATICLLYNSDRILVESSFGTVRMNLARN